MPRAVPLNLPAGPRNLLPPAPPIGGFRGDSPPPRPAPPPPKPLTLRPPLWGVAEGDAGLRPALRDGAVALCRDCLTAGRAAEAAGGRVILLATFAMLRAYLGGAGEGGRVLLDPWPGSGQHDRLLPSRGDRILPLAAALAAVERAAAEDAELACPALPGPADRKRTNTKGKK